MEMSTNTSNETGQVVGISPPYGEPYWIISETLLVIMTVITVYVTYRIWRYSYPYCLLTMKGKNGKILYRLCLLGSMSLLLTVSCGNIFVFYSWQSSEVCNTSVRIYMLFYSVSVQMMIVIYWFLQYYFTYHPVIRSETSNKFIEAARKIVMFLLVLYFSNQLFTYIVGDFHALRINATAKGCVLVIDDPSMSLFITIHRFVLLLSIAALYFPLYRTLKRKIAEDLGSDIADGHEAKTFFMENSSSIFQSKLRKKKELLQRLRRILKIMLVVIVTDMVLNLLFVMRTYMQVLMILANLQIVIDILAAISFLTRSNNLLFPTKRRITMVDLGDAVLISSCSSQDTVQDMPLDNFLRPPILLQGSIVTMGKSRPGKKKRGPKFEPILSSSWSSL